MSLYKRKDSDMFWIGITHNGRRIQQSTGTSDPLQAKEYHDRFKASLWEQQRLGIKPSHSWKEAVVRWLQETSDKATHKEDIVKLKWLDPHLGPLNLDQITVDVINQVKLEKLKEASKSTVNRYLALIRSILLRTRDEWEWVDKVPKVKLYKEAVGRVRYINQEQVTTLLKELPAHQRDLVLFALHTGLRQSNVLNLEWSRINLELNHAWVEAEQSKNRHPIAVPLNDEAMAILHRQLGKHPARVFTYAGKPLGNANTRAWRNALKRAGIADFRWHDLRHTWATWHRQAGTPTHELQRLGGWKTSAMVERYAHLAPEQLASAAARLNAVGSCYDSATAEMRKGLQFPVTP